MDREHDPATPMRVAQLVIATLPPSQALALARTILRYPERFTVLFNAELVGRVFEQEQLVRELLRIAAMCRRGGDA